MTKKITKKQLAEDKAWEELKEIKCISKDILDIIPVCSDDGCRPILGGVYATNDKYLATDSYIALEIKRDKQKELEVSEFPAMDKLPLKVEPMVLQLKSMRKLQKFFGSTLPVLKLGCLFPGASEHSVKLVTTNLENTTEISYRKIDGEYPIKSINDIPESKLSNKHITIKLYKNLLVKLLKGFGKENEIKLSISQNKTKGLTPLIIESENRKGLIMPLR